MGSGLPLSSFSCRPKGLSSFGPAQRRVCGVGRGQVLAAGIGVGSRKGSRRRNLRPTDGACYLPLPFASQSPAGKNGIPKGKLPFGLAERSSVRVPLAACLLRPKDKRERGSARAGAAGPGGLGEREEQLQACSPRFEHAGGNHRDGCAAERCPREPGIDSVRSMTLLRRRE